MPGVPVAGRILLVVGSLVAVWPALSSDAPSAGESTSGTVPGGPVSAVIPALVGVLVAQQPRAGREGCDLVRSRRLNSILDSAGQRVTYISGPLAFQCEDGTRIRADSVVDFQATGFRQLMGGVEIDGPETRLVADRVHRSDDVGRIEAWGSVEVEQMASNTRMMGDSLVFFEVGPAREESELTMRGERPYAVLRLGGEGGQGGVDEVGAPGAAGSSSTPPDTVFADRLHLVGESRFVGTGTVQVRRSEMDAFGDSLDFARDQNLARLFGKEDELARIEGEEFDLVGRRVDLFLREDQVEEIRAADQARLTGEDVEMDAPRIRIFMTDGEAERLVAVRERTEADSADTGAAGDADGGVPAPTAPAPSVDRAGDGRPEAVAEEFVLWADSIEVSAPGQRLERVDAVGIARGESLARDSLNTPEMPEMIRRDWIEGDTVVAHFVPTDSAGPDRAGPEAASAPEADEADRSEYTLERLVATGSARSLYRLAPQDSVSVVSVDEEDGAEVEEEPDAAAPEAETGLPDADVDDGAGRAGPVADGDSLVVVGAPRAEPTDSTGATGSTERRRPPAVHYVVGDRITIVLIDGEVGHMEVQGQTRGLYLEPRGGGSPEQTP